MNTFNVSGKLNALNLQGCLASIGPVIVSIDRNNLQKLVDSIHDIQKQKTANLIATPMAVNLQNSQWTAIGIVRDRDVYSLNFRGICWEVACKELHNFIQDAALPFLARGTVNQLLKLI
jgi:hypothetical protein